MGEKLEAIALNWAMSRAMTTRWLPYELKTAMIRNIDDLREEVILSLLEEGINPFERGADKKKAYKAVDHAVYRFAKFLGWRKWRHSDNPKKTQWIKVEHTRDHWNILETIENGAVCTAP